MVDWEPAAAVTGGGSFLPDEDELELEEEKVLLEPTITNNGVSSSCATNPTTGNKFLGGAIHTAVGGVLLLL